MRPPTDLLTAGTPASASPGGARQATAPSPGQSLDDLGIVHDSELSSLARDELRRWQWLLAPLREARFDLLDIGSGDGASLRVWRDWFPQARLVGLDVRRVTTPDIDGCTIVHGCQTDPDLLRALTREHRFRLVIDDGSPHADDTLGTFLTLFPWLETNGLYLCAGLEGTRSHQPADPVPVERGGTATPAWFAGLALTLGMGPRAGMPTSAWPAVADVQRHARGVVLFSTSAAVLS